MTYPSIIFIIPYRNRPEQKFVFEKYMSYIMEDYNKTEYELFFIEQKDKCDFNRGALKNIGFIAMREKYPEHYKSITFVFNDVDTFPYKKGVLDFKTQKGILKHFFGFKNTLGGIFSVNGTDFERVLGFPNFWTWGYEDNVIYNKVLKDTSLSVDRSCFFPIFDHHIVHMTDSLKRTINMNQYDDKDPIIEQNNNIYSLVNIKYEIVGNVIEVNYFDIYLSYTETIHKYEMKLTDNPTTIQNIKRKFISSNHNSRQMQFM
jgi:hypothetical protein